MSDFTFLTREQCFGGDKLDILKKRGIEVAITDFAVLLGGRVFGTRVKNDSSLEERTGNYRTRSDEGIEYVREVAMMVMNLNFQMERVIEMWLLYG